MNWPGAASGLRLTAPDPAAALRPPVISRLAFRRTGQGVACPAGPIGREARHWRRRWMFRGTGGSAPSGNTTPAFCRTGGESHLVTRSQGNAATTGRGRAQPPVDSIMLRCGNPQPGDCHVKPLSTPCNDTSRTLTAQGAIATTRNLPDRGAWRSPHSHADVIPFAGGLYDYPPSLPGPTFDMKSGIGFQIVAVPVGCVVGTLSP